MSGSVTFCLSPGGQTFLSHSKRGGQTFFVGGRGGYDEVGEQIDLSEANFLVSEVNISRSP